MKASRLPVYRCNVHSDLSIQLHVVTVSKVTSLLKL